MSKRRRPPQLSFFAETPKPFFITPIDREPILSEWRERCARVVAELARVLEDTRAFQDRALPAYRAWVAREFGVELSGLRDLAEELAKAEAIRHAVEAEAAVRERGFAAAYQSVMARKKLGEDLFPADFDTPGEDDWEEGWSEVDPFTDYHAESARDRDSDEKFEDSSRKIENSSPPPTPTADDDRLRALYRKLAFALHPDANPNVSARERELWAEVQSAYESRDLTRLEILFAWVEAGGDGDFSRVEHIATLQAVFRDRTHELRITSSAFHRIKKDPAWRFWTAAAAETSLDVLRVEIESELLREFLRLRKKITHHEALFHKWATGQSRRSK